MRIDEQWIRPTLFIFFLVIVFNLILEKFINPEFTLKKNVGLTELDLSDNPIGDEGVIALSNALITNTTLKSLKLCNNNFADDGAKALSEALQKNSSLTKLNLADNNISAIGARELATAIKRNSALTSLILSRNPIYSGALWIADALNDNTTLTELDLSNCKFEYYEAKKIAEALERNTSLTSLRLSGNYLDNYGPLCFARTLKTNASLRSLELGNTHIDNEGAKEIAEALKNNFTLTELFFMTAEINGEIQKAIFIYLKRNCGLKTLEAIRFHPDIDTTELSESINDLVVLQDTQPEARDAIALFITKFFQYGMIQNALELFAQDCIDNESAAEALFHAIFAAGEAQNPFTDEFSQPERCQLLLLLGEKSLRQHGQESVLCTLLYGIQTGVFAPMQVSSLEEFKKMSPDVRIEDLCDRQKLPELLKRAITHILPVERSLFEPLVPVAQSTVSQIPTTVPVEEILATPQPAPELKEETCCTIYLPEPQTEHLSLTSSASARHDFPVSAQNELQTPRTTEHQQQQESKQQAMEDADLVMGAQADLQTHKQENVNEAIKRLLLTVFSGTDISIITLPTDLGTVVEFKKEPSLTKAKQYLEMLSTMGLKVTFRNARPVVANIKSPAKIKIENSPEEIRSIVSSSIAQYEPVVRDCHTKCVNST